MYVLYQFFDSWVLKTACFGFQFSFAITLQFTFLLEVRRDQNRVCFVTDQIKASYLTYLYYGYSEASRTNYSFPCSYYVSFWRNFFNPSIYFQWIYFNRIPHIVIGIIHLHQTIIPIDIENSLLFCFYPKVCIF